jgi:exo-1,4-beta-D-glucosaminidase
VLTLPEIQGLSPTYFVKLLLEDSAGKLVSSNFYWLSTKAETLNEAKSTWYYTPTRDYADYKALSTLPAVELKASAGMKTRGGQDVARVTVENPSKNLAFFVRLKIQKGTGGEEVLPVLWEDNYFSLLPGEKREFTATVEAQNWQSAGPVLVVEGWNVTPRLLPVTR